MFFTFEIFKNRAGQWRWRLRASNGKIIANSGESYHNKKDLDKSIRFVRYNSTVAITKIL